MSAHDQPGPSTSRDCAIDELSAQDQPGPSAGRVRAIDEMTAYERDRLQNIKDIYEQVRVVYTVDLSSLARTCRQTTISQFRICECL